MASLCEKEKVGTPLWLIESIFFGMNSASSALESGGLAHISQWGKVYTGSEQYMLPARWHLFQLRLCIFQKDNAELYAAFITAAQIRNRIEMWVLNWPAGILHSSNHGRPVQNEWLSDC